MFLLSCDDGGCGKKRQNYRESSLYFIDKEGIHEIDLENVYTPVIAVFD